MKPQRVMLFVVLVMTAVSAQAEAPVVKSWEFNAPADLDSLAKRNPSGLELKDGALVAPVTPKLSKLVFWVHGAVSLFNPADVKALELRIKIPVDVREVALLMRYGGQGPAANVSHVLARDVKGSGEFRVFRINTDQLPKWLTGDKVHYIGLNFTGAASDSQVTLDYLRLLTESGASPAQAQ